MESEIWKERLSEREKERDRVCCKREKIIERKTGLESEIWKERLSEREKERDRFWCQREKIIKRETGMGKRNRERETV